MTPHPLDLKLADAAAQWLIELEDDAGPETRAAFLAWLSTSPRHMREFLLAASAYKTLNLAGASDDAELDELIRAASVNVVPLRDADPLVLPETPLAIRSPAMIPALRRRLTIAAAAALLATGAWLVESVLHLSSTHLATAMGEQRTFKLADGSVVYLNARSKVGIHFSSRRRDVQLIEGEALFAVASDLKRPFLVEAGAATVQALGTEFNVYRRKDATTVSVVEGRVKVLEDDAPLAAGEEVTVANGGHIVKRGVDDIPKAVAWRQRRLVFRADSLPDIVAQFGRYSSMHIQLEDDAVRKRSITGIFNADEPIALVNFLKADPELEIRPTRDGFAIRSK